MAEERVRRGATQQESSVEMDAVCERCGNVNPEETLLCKNCGNNLRDQRARRMASMQTYEDLEPSGPKTRWLTGLLPLLGLLVIVWTAMNVSRIEDWLVSAQTSDTTGGVEYFEGLGSRPFEELAAEMDKTPVTQEQLNLAMSQPANPEGYEGHFAIVRRTAIGTELFGQARVARKGGELIFVARLDNGMEIRGTAEVGEGGRAECQNLSARFRGEYASGNGVAQRAEGLGYGIYGVLDVGDAGYEATAYAIPEAAEK